MAVVVEVCGLELEKPNWVRLPDVTSPYRIPIRSKVWIAETAELCRKNEPFTFKAEMVRALFVPPALIAQSTLSVRRRWAIKMARWIRNQHGKLNAGFFKTDVHADRMRLSGGGRPTELPELRQALFDWFVDYREKYARISRELFRAKAEELLQVVIERAKEQVINLTRWFDILLNMNIVNHHFKLFLNFNILTEPKFRGISALSIQ